MGVTSAVFFRYDVCDIDFYTEAAVGVAVRPARRGGPAIVDLLSSLANDTGGTDVALSVPTPKQTAYRSGERVSPLKSYTSIDGRWHSTFSQTNTLAPATMRFPHGVDVEIGEGRMADGLRSRTPIRATALDVLTDGQLALHIPVPTSVPAG